MFDDVPPAAAVEHDEEAAVRAALRYDGVHLEVAEFLRLARFRGPVFDRVAVEAGLNAGESPYAIGRRIGKCVRSVTREIRNRSVAVSKCLQGKVNNRCVHAGTCMRRGLCVDCYFGGTHRCVSYHRCNKVCRAFVEKVCPKLCRPPYVCNGCRDQKSCVFGKRYYRADEAERNYRALLVEPRRGANVTEEEIALFDGTLRELTARGQSVHAAMVANPELFPLSEKTVYRYVNSGLQSVRRGDLPRACMIKPRRSKPQECKVDKKCRIGRTYADYREHLAAHPGTGVVEMDTVEGVKGGKVLLTLMFMPSDFMAAILLERKATACVADAFGGIFSRIGERCRKSGQDPAETFMRLFPVVLTDRGTEFSLPDAVERPAGGGKLTSVFYCDARAAFQKPHVERNHENLRRVLPKGSSYFEPASFDDLGQEDIALLMSHVNGYPRRTNSDETSYDAFARAFGANLAEEVFGIVRIAPNDVTLKPSLLGIEVKVKK